MAPEQSVEGTGRNHFVRADLVCSRFLVRSTSHSELPGSRDGRVFGQVNQTLLGKKAKFGARLQA